MRPASADGSVGRGAEAGTVTDDVVVVVVVDVLGDPALEDDLTLVEVDDELLVDWEEEVVSLDLVSD